MSILKALSILYALVATGWTSQRVAVQLFGRFAYFDIQHQHEHFSSANVANIDSEYSDTSPLFLGKAFGDAMQPSKIYAFYYRSTPPALDNDDITITTIVTGNRFETLARLAQKYRGPISATVHITSTPTQERDALLNSLHVLYASAPYMSTYVDIHLVLDPFERQFNLWRNIARYYARTNYVMMLDVDFAVCTDFRGRIKKAMRGGDAGSGVESTLLARMKEGRMALVVPAFEYTKQKDGLNSSTFPTNKAELMELVKEDKIGVFHRAWKAGHGPTDYDRFYASSPGQIYKVSTYQYSYEPYVIFKKVGTPWCDQRFIGYGGNKAACLFELYLSGVSFYVLPDDFLIHQSHAYAEQVRKHERKFNNKVYADFREEICLRYIVRSLHEGVLHTERGHNAQEACLGMPSAAKIASELMGSFFVNTPDAR